MIHNWFLFSFVFVLFFFFTAWRVTKIIFNINNVLFFYNLESWNLKKIPDDNCNWMLIPNIHWSYKCHILYIAYSNKEIIICESNYPLHIDLIIWNNDWSLTPKNLNLNKTSWWIYLKIKFKLSIMIKHLFNINFDSFSYEDYSSTDDN